MRRCSADGHGFSHLRELMYAVLVALRLRSRCGMKIAPRTPVLLSRRPVAASPSAEARRPTVRPLTSARSGVRERAVLFAGSMASRGPEAAAPVAPARPPDRPMSGAPGDRPALTSSPVGSGRAEAAGGPKPAPGFHGAVTEFKRRLIETTLTELGGNRTRAARALGLQRTYTVVFAGGVVSRRPEAAAPVVPARPPGRPVSAAASDPPARTSPPVVGGRAEAAGGPEPAPGFHGAVAEFKRRLIETTLTDLGGNRTRAARALGLQRTYLLRNRPSDESTLNPPDGRYSLEYPPLDGFALVGFEGVAVAAG